MKFLCPSCKAKYQIADEKVSGRSVRMKCRKCGAEIRITNTEAVLTLPPPPAAEAESREERPSQSMDRVSRPSPVAVPSAVSTTKVTGTPLPDAARARGAAAPAPAAAVNLKQVPPRPPGSVGAAKNLSRPLNPRVSVRSDGAAHSLDKAPQRGTSHALKAQPAVASSPAPAPVRMESPQEKPLTGFVPGPEEFGDEEQTRISDAGILAGAFSAAVSSATAPVVSDPLTMPGDEWFVGINGVPVGPIRLSELRSKASTGAVTKESLVWRDGFEEWRPLKSFPELIAVVEESLSSAMASAAPLVVPKKADAVSDPFGPTLPQVAGSAATPAVVTGAAVVRDDLEAAGLRPRRGFTEKAAWLAIAMALGLGVTLGSVFFDKKPVEVVRYVEPPKQPAAPASVAEPSNVLPETAIPGDASAKPTSGKVVAKPAATQAKPAESAAKSGLNLPGLPGGVSGPGGPSGNALAGPTSQLDSGQVQQTVARYTPSVKRSCWQPALDTRDKDASTSARVVVTIQVAANGSVLNASTATGDPKGYRGLANCIVGRVRGWQFPASSGQTTVNVPFVFVAQ